MATGAATLVPVVAERTGIVLDPERAVMISAFSAAACVLPQLVRGRVIAIGDAAHQISPIGGQGMTLGLLDAVELAPLLGAHRADPAGDPALRDWQQARRRAAARARWQSELNMLLGRPGPAPVIGVRNRAIAGIAGSQRVRRVVARRFAMVEGFDR